MDIVFLLIYVQIVWVNITKVLNIKNRDTSTQSPPFSVYQMHQQGDESTQRKKRIFFEILSLLYWQTKAVLKEWLWVQRLSWRRTMIVLNTWLSKRVFRTTPELICFIWMKQTKLKLWILLDYMILALRLKLLRLMWKTNFAFL